MAAEHRLLDELESILAQGGDRHQRAKRIVEAIRLAGAYRWVGLYDVDTQRGLVSNIAWSGSGAPAHPIFPTNEGLTSRAIAAKKTINVGDVAGDPDYLTFIPD